ncbi:olfactory receptor 9A4-like protein [Cricetulus griseus]|uniref:Olfactory receptor 9A4-like protein n=1 Tax=Cricetulus griseus TaxID=10029 RepID=A0A061IMM4_CRIGR|nr:olfactory receptor 9A4-like protein [Cricetulus griseus]
MPQLIQEEGQSHDQKNLFDTDLKLGNKSQNQVMDNLSSATEFCLLGFPGSQELQHILFAMFFFFYSVTLLGNMIIITIVCVGTTEFAVLGAMAVDRHVAVCNPLGYSIIMNSHTCIWVVIVSWAFGFLSEVWPAYATFQFTFCKSNLLDHFYCDRDQLLQLSCDNTFLAEFILFLMAIFIIIGSLILTIVSYTYIISTILKIPSASGRKKAFSTGASYFTFVIIGYGSCLFLYVKPKQTQAAEYNRVASLLVSVVTPFKAEPLHLHSSE